MTKDFVIARLGCLAGARMHAFGAIVLGDGIDAIALLKVSGGHTRHVVLHDLRRISHALRTHPRRLSRQRKPYGSRKNRCDKQTIAHVEDLSWVVAPSLVVDRPSKPNHRRDFGRFAAVSRRLHLPRKNNFLPVKLCKEYKPLPFTPIRPIALAEVNVDRNGWYPANNLVWIGRQRTFARSHHRTHGQEQIGRSRSSESGRYQFIILQPQRDVPAARLFHIDGSTVLLSSLRGRPILLNFWATWCPPCRTGLPILDRLQGVRAPQSRSGGLKVLAVAVDRADRFDRRSLRPERSE